MIRISAIAPSITICSASRVNETSSPEPSATRAPSVSSAVWPWAATSTSMPLSSSQRCSSPSSRFASSTTPGTASVNAAAWSPIGSASTATRRADDHDQREEDGQHGQAAREPRPLLEQRDERVQQQRQQRGDDEDERDRAGRPQQRVAAEDRQRQRDRLDPPWHHHRHSPPLRRLLACLHRLRLCAVGWRSSSVPRLHAILFVGDVVGSAGRRVAQAMLGPLREELAADFVVVNGENAVGRHRHHAEARRRALPRRRRRDHARQPHVPAPRDLAVPRAAPRDRPARQLPARPSLAAAPRPWSAAASRSAS